MKKRICMLLCCLLLLSAAVLPIGATIAVPYDSSVYDRADLLSDEERRNVQENAVTFYLSTGCNFVLFTYSNPDPEENILGEEFFDVWGVPEYANLILLCVKQEGKSYYYDLYLYGEAERLLTPDEVDIVLDDGDVYPNLKSGKIHTGVLAFLYVAMYEMTNEQVRPNPYLQALPVACIIAAVIAVITCLMVKRQYSMKKKSVDYPLEHYAKLELTEHSDLFAGSVVTHRVIQSNSGGRSGGGGSRGGGRGHAGGR